MAEFIRSFTVPASLELETKIKFLGLATHPFWKLREELGLFGYPETDEIEAALKKALEIE